MYVFVYGTLRKGERNHMLLKDAKFIGNNKVKGKKYFLFSFPSVDIEDVSDEVVVEIYEIDENILKSLDVLEGYPRLYDRKLIKTIDNQYEGWIYCMDKDKIMSYLKVDDN